MKMKAGNQDGELNRESREKVADAVKAILAKIDKEENCETIQE